MLTWTDHAQLLAVRLRCRACGGAAEAVLPSRFALLASPGDVHGELLHALLRGAHLAASPCHTAALPLAARAAASAAGARLGLRHAPVRRDDHGPVAVELRDRETTLVGLSDDPAAAPVSVTLADGESDPVARLVAALGDRAPEYDLVELADRVCARWGWRAVAG